MINMNREYDANISSCHPSYSNMKSYGTDGRSEFIVAPVLATISPSLFFNVKPHPLPKWMNPKNVGPELSHGQKCVQCDPYACLSSGKDNCKSF